MKSMPDIDINFIVYEIQNYINISLTVIDNSSSVSSLSAYLTSKQSQLKQFLDQFKYEKELLPAISPLLTWDKEFNVFTIERYKYALLQVQDKLQRLKRN